MVVSGELVQLPPCPSDDHEFDYATKSWKLDAAQVNAALLDGIRRQRDRLLTASDWTQLPGSPLSDEQVAAFQSYRQELRD
ncbi:MAG: hypothetical protein HOA06_07785, partial [Chloroflexi bacterium]|nr:hypothetical protein [Chloroflexota bacterium]